MQYLYLIKCQQFYKIGIANDVESRLAQLSTGNPFELEVLAVYGFANAQVVEASLHQRFTNSRVRGEWFALNNSELAILDQVCQYLGGIPEEVKPIANEEDVAVAEQEQELIGGLGWRLERRPDRNPPGFAVYQRGKEKKYLTYISANTLKNPNAPTIEEVENALAQLSKE